MGAGGPAFEKLVREQHGLITREQALSHGFTDYDLRSRRDSGSWGAPFSGVYSVYPGELDRIQCLRAAALKCGPDAIISHGSAAFVHGIWGFTLPAPESKYYGSLNRKLNATPIDVTVPAEKRPRIAPLTQPISGLRVPLRVHRFEDTEAHVEVKNGIRCTTFVRTICDLAESLFDGHITRHQFVPAYEDAYRRKLRDDVHDLAMSLRPGRPHLELLYDVMLRHGRFIAPVESELEAICDDLLCRAELRPPVRQFPIRNEKGWIIARGDFAWPEDRFVIDVYGREFHEGDSRFNSDKEREFQIQQCGYRLLIVTAQHVRHWPDYIIDNTRPYVNLAARKRASRSAEK